MLPLTPMFPQPDINSTPMMYVIRIVPMILVMGTIFFLSHQSGKTLHLPSFQGADKLAHMIAYGVLAFSIFWFLGQKGLERPGRAVLIVIVACFLYGMTDEYHQSFIAFRSPSMYDLLADTAGAFCCSLIWGLNSSLRQKIPVYQNKLLAATH